MDHDFTQPCHDSLTAYDAALRHLRSLPTEDLVEEMEGAAPIWVTLRVVPQL